MNEQQGCSQMNQNGQGDQEPDFLDERMGNIGRKLLVLSGKGGVGKSTVAVNLARGLAKAGKKVGLLDVDVHGPSLPSLLGVADRRAEMTADGLIPMQAGENLTMMSVGLLLNRPDEAVIWRGPRKYGVIRQLLADVHWGELDYLVVDAPPGTGDEPLSVAQLVGAGASAVIVTTPQELAIVDVRRCVRFCREVELPIAGIVENMSGYICPSCGDRVDLFASGGGRKLAEELGAPLLGEIPIDPKVVAAGDAGLELGTGSDASAAAEVFAAIAGQILDGDRGDETNKLPEETRRMKIAIPLAEGRLAMHFGHCQEFALVETNQQNEIVATTAHTPPPHEPGVLPAWLAEQGAKVIIAGGMGSRAQQLFAQQGISVVVGAPASEPEQLVAAYLAGTLTSGENACDH